MSEEKPKRRWFRFSLRGLFVAVTLLCIWMGWQVQIVRERQAVRKWLNEKGHEIRINELNEFTWRRKWMLNREHISAFRKLLGDTEADGIVFNSPELQKDRSRVRRAFPTSLIGGWASIEECDEDLRRYYARAGRSDRDP